MTARWMLSLAAGACLVLAGCTLSPGASSSASAGPSTSPGPSTGPAAPSSSTAPIPTSTSPARPKQEYLEPLAIAVHRSRGDIDITAKMARAIVEGRPVSWEELTGESGEVVVRRGVPGLHAARRNPAAVAVIAASETTPLVQVVSVDGLDPLRQPARYPLQIPAADPLPAVTRVTVVGDIMLGRRVATAPRPPRFAGDPAAPLQPLKRRLAGADLTIGNLESTLSDAGWPRQGDDSFAADPAALKGLADAGFDVLSLANNHTGDYGPTALRRTLRAVADSPIAQVGAGSDRTAAWKPAVVERGGVRFGFLAFNAIGETPAARPHRPGVAQIRMQPRTGPLSMPDLRRAQRKIRSLAARVDVVIVLPHWGDQYTAEPVRDQRRVGRALLDAGADIVVGGHPHWVQGVQVHRGDLVVHSLGNFVFDMDFSAETREGVMLEAVFWGDEIRGVDFRPYVIGPDFAPRLVGATRSAAILDRMARASDAPFG